MAARLGSSLMTTNPPEDRANDSAAEVAAQFVVPEWVTDELIQKTLEVWQPHYRDPLTAEDAAYIILSVGRLFETLSKTAGGCGSSDPRL